ncbi:MAG: hypothetical protein HFI92_13440 [Lachnospiraceae bacterium]|nr:hypothetical protein [Lachnospiraceae bacterium]
MRETLLDFGNGMEVPKTVIEKAADVSIDAMAKEIPEEYLCMAVLQEVLVTAKRKIETASISFSQQYPEEHMI